MKWTDLSHGRVREVDCQRLTAVLVRIVEENHTSKCIWDNIVAHPDVRAAVQAHPTLVTTVLAACRTQRMFDVAIDALEPPLSMLMRTLRLPFTYKNHFLLFQLAATDPNDLDADIVERFLRSDMLYDGSSHAVLHQGWFEYPAITTSPFGIHRMLIQGQLCEWLVTHHHEWITRDRLTYLLTQFGGYYCVIRSQALTHILKTYATQPVVNVSVLELWSTHRFGEHAPLDELFSHLECDLDDEVLERLGTRFEGTLAGEFVQFVKDSRK